MKRINIFYVFTGLLGAAFIFISGSMNESPTLSFYGFAESDETEINYNHSVLVEKILVGSGEKVSKGDTLMMLQRIKTKEYLDDYDFKIDQLNSERSEWRKKQSQEIAELEDAKSSELKALHLRLDRTRQELEYKEQLSKDLDNVNSSTTTFNPLKEKIKEIENKISEVEKSYDLRISNIKSIIAERERPHAQRVSQINLERKFDESQKLISIAVVAPDDGIIGNISCKVDEHIPSYNTLLTFYEPHSKYVRGYVHEDLTLQVELGNKFEVSSLKDESITYEGEVTGLGSRIIEIPSRLRKAPELKSYGREVIVRIGDNSSFLQKEKVSLSFKSNP